jgi:sugar/nucleoside kinase (ribokinase family)
MIKLLVVGTVAIDSLETPFGQRDAVFGGSASYFSYSASFFSPVSLMAVVGADFPEGYRKVLEERQIDLRGLQVLAGKTFRWKGRYDFDLNVAKTLETHLNVLQEFSPSLGQDRDVEFLFLANIDPDIQLQMLDEVHAAKTRLVALDTMNFWIHQKNSSLEKVLRRVDLLVLNDGEARDLTRQPNLIRAGRIIQEMGPGRVVIKKGEHGVLYFDQSHFFALPAYPLEAVFDPTGAGDTFAGGMMGYLAKTGDLGFENMKTAIAYGTMMASFVVEDFGLERMRRLTEEEIEERLDAFKRFSSF